MPTSIEALESEVLRLSTADRKRLLDRVIQSLDADAVRDAAWDALAAQRDADIELGNVEAVTLDEALARLRAELQ